MPAVDALQQDDDGSWPYWDPARQPSGVRPHRLPDGTVISLDVTLRRPDGSPTGPSEPAP